MLSDPYWFHRVPNVVITSLGNDDERIWQWGADVGVWAFELHETRIDERIFQSFLRDLTEIQLERADWYDSTAKEKNLQTARQNVKREFQNVERFRRALMFG